MSRPKVAFQGVPGAFSDQACAEFVPDHEPVAFDSFEAAVAAVQTGQCELGCLPVHNVTAGPVPEMARLLPVSGLTVVEERDLIVRQNLMALPGVKLQELTAIASHPMALGQCARFLMDLATPLETAFDTAGAARDLAESGDRQRGVIAARRAAELNGLEILAEDIQDDPNNWTRFAIVKR
jgi:prephenate dehydratase